MRSLDLLSPFECEHLPLVDADLRFWRRTDLDRSQNQLLSELIDSTAWRQEQITVYGKPYLQPRLSAWYGDSGYSYSGIRLEPTAWNSTLLDIKTRIEALTGNDYNSVLLNYYRDHNDGMGMHSDDERELGRKPAIASLSLGEERVFLLKHKSRKDLRTKRLPLPCGSLLLMSGDTQRHWKHGIAKTRKPCGPRINLTFRKVFSTHEAGKIS